MVICFLIILEESFQIYYREKHTIDYKTPNRVVEYNIENLKIVTRIRRQGLLKDGQESCCEKNVPNLNHDLRMIWPPFTTDLL